MPVYMLQCGDHSGVIKPVKIGWSANGVPGRVRALQTAHWEKLTILRVVEGPATAERWFQRHLQHRHLGMEWYDFVPEMLTLTLDDVRTTEPVHCPRPRWQPGQPVNSVRDVVQALGGSGVISREIKTALNSVVWWTHRERIPVEHFNALVDLAKERGVEDVTHALLAKVCRARKVREPVQPQDAA